MTAKVRGWIEALASVKLGVWLMAALMVLVTLCTLDQVRLGIFGAVRLWIRSPAGALVGLLLVLNIGAGLWVRLEWRSRRAGLLLAHAGVLLLIAGEFVTAGFAREANMAVEVGQTKSYTEHQRSFELAFVDASAPDHDRVVAIPERLLRRGGELKDPALPFPVTVEAYLPNARIVRRAGSAMAAEPVPEARGDDEVNAPAARVAIGGQPAVLVSADLESRPVTAGGQRWRIALRAARRYLPFSLTLKEFTHEVYPGTDVPKNFASLVRLDDARTGESRDVLIWMNHPLRHGGLTFYQASYGKGDTLSIFQVVRNPGWTVPYLACAMVALGLAWHFMLALWGRKP